MATRGDRLARNETLFRDVNERVLDVNRSFEADDGRMDFICECSQDDCLEPVQLTLAEYEAVRSDPARFLVLPGHISPLVETVVAKNERFAVVEKYPGEREIAEQSHRRG